MFSVGATAAGKKFRSTPTAARCAMGAPLTPPRLEIRRSRRVAGRLSPEILLAL